MDCEVPPYVETPLMLQQVSGDGLILQGQPYKLLDHNGEYINSLSSFSTRKLIPLFCHLKGHLTKELLKHLLS